MQLSNDKQYDALLKRDPSYEGLFFVGVKTTGIFCRPTCHAKKPKRKNVEFFKSAKDALLRGYRPCKACFPLEPKGRAPTWLRPLLTDVHKNQSLRINDSELRRRKLDPNRVRRWFKKNHNMTFQAYLRSLRIGQAFGQLAHGEGVTEVALSNGYDSLSGFHSAFKRQYASQPKDSKYRNVIHVAQILSPLGPLLAGSTRDGICLLEFTDRRMLETQIKILKSRYRANIVPSLKGPYVPQLRRELKEYFLKKRKKFTVPLSTLGTEFQNEVWRELQRIPFGKTRSYQEQAKAIGMPKAVRAVANANGQNRIAILIPCHRVIGSNGKLTGYGGGLWRKKYLLDLERLQ